MALEIIHQEANDVPNYTVKERYCLTEPDEEGAQRLVLEGDPDARWLYAIPGQEIPWAEAQRYGLVESDAPEHEDDPAGAGEAEAEADDDAADDGPSLAERIDAVASHAQANELAAELGVDGFEQKKPGLEAKKKALHEAAAAVESDAPEHEDDPAA